MEQRASPPWQCQNIIRQPPMRPKTWTQFRSFLQACMNGSEPAMLNLLEDGHCRAYFLQEGLQRVISRNNIHLTRVILELGAPINSSAASAVTDSMSLPITKLLVLEYGLNVNMEISEGENMLRRVTENEDLTRWLLEQGSAVDPMNGKNPGGEYRYTSLDVAAGFCSIDIVNLMLEHGADKSISTPLHFAARQGGEGAERIPIMARLIEVGFDVNGSDEIRHFTARGTPLNYAVEAKSLAKVQFLLNHGARPCKRTNAYASDPLTQAKDADLSDIVAAMEKKM